MELLHEWINAIKHGGWSGLLMGGFTIVLAMFVFAFISNKYFWLVLVLAAAGYVAYLYL